MTKELRFFAKYAAQQTGSVAVFGAVALAGSWWMQSSSDLFTNYVRMFPVFLMLFPLLFAMSSRAYLEVALCCGATRRAAYGAMQVAYLLQTAGIGLVTLAVSVLGPVLNPQMNALTYTPAFTLLIALMAAACCEVGLAVGTAANSKGRTAAIVITVLIGVIAAAVVLTVVMLFFSSDTELAQAFTLASPALWLAAAVLLAIGLAGGLYGWKAYRKLVVNR